MRNLMPAFYYEVMKCSRGCGERGQSRMRENRAARCGSAGDWHAGRQVK